MDPPVLFPASPGMPLFPLSPERVNGTRPPYNGSNKDLPPLPQSPSLPNLKDDVFAPASPTHDFSTSPFRHLRSHARTGSDAHVQGMVARFNSLEIRDHKESSKRDEIAVKRAEMARELAQSNLERCQREMEGLRLEAANRKEEGRKLKKELDESRERERKVGKRCEVVMEEYQREKEQYARAQAIYEKEIKRSRKEAFKSSSALVKMQEELKATRNSLRITQSGFETEKLKSAKREQEAFTAQYQLVAVQEELAKARAQIKIVEEERDALKTSLKEEEVARIAAEGKIPLPVSSKDEEDEFDSPKKSPRKQPRIDSEMDDKENMLPKRAVELKAMQQELDFEKRRRERAEEQVEFMKMECQFKCCSCRVAEQHGTQYAHDESLAKEVEQLKTTLCHSLTPPSSHHEDDEMVDAIDDVADEPASIPVVNEQPSTPPATPKEETMETECRIAFSPTTGTFQRIPAATRALEEEQQSSMLPQLFNEATAIDLTAAAFDTEKTPKAKKGRPIFETLPSTDSNKENHAPSPPTSGASTPTLLADSPPSTPPANPPNTFTTPLYRELPLPTTTIPIHFSPTPPRAQPTTPSTIAQQPSSKDLPFDREAALEAIRQRRGRARSMAAGQATPVKGLLVGGVRGERRDVSAPALKSRWGGN